MNTAATATATAPVTTVTRAQFVEQLTLALKAEWEWARTDETKLATFLGSVRTTLAGRKTVIIDSGSFRKAWRACGLTGRPTYQGLHALVP